jgi:hypothetical protein
MGLEYRRRHKELLGKPYLVGQDVFKVTVSSVSGLVGHTTLGGDGSNRLVCPRAGLLDCLVVNVSPALTAGTLSVALHKNGVVVHSGSLSSANPNLVEKFWNIKHGNEVVLASGDLLQTHYAISSALSPGVSSYSVSARLGLRYRETNV